MGAASTGEVFPADEACPTDGQAAPGLLSQGLDFQGGAGSVALENQVDAVFLTPGSGGEILDLGEVSSQ